MYKTVIMLFLFFIVYIGAASPVFAAPTDKEVSKLIQSIGWTKQDLEEFLSTKELELNHFQNTKELKEVIGTPITPDSLEELLHTYNMTREELDILLAGFNEKVQDYWNIEDLDVAIDFYQNHENLMVNLEEFFLNVGITDQEKNNLYTHFKTLNEEAINTKIGQWKVKANSLSTIDPESELTQAQQNELTALWEDISKTLGLHPKFFKVDDNGKQTNLSLSDLSTTKLLDTVTMELYDNKNNLVLNLILSPEILTASFAVDAAEKVVSLTELSEELTTLYQSQLPNTASLAPLFLFTGYLLVLIGIFLLIWKKKKVSNDQ
ncbi:processed acidic surface protein [Niallia nealsonii]|uniref:Processed acidic surface protein n=1 Tax=Niallia nealsonii TaxID=115979 RepID=A0A2N0YYQ9_9BACI|nr:processed acidic surface protein [Niallia nealsonii]PKG22389.1 processed acidic surface protein [Niallia nealsonii]